MANGEAASENRAELGPGHIAQEACIEVASVTWLGRPSLEFSFDPPKEPCRACDSLDEPTGHSQKEPGGEAIMSRF